MGDIYQELKNRALDVISKDLLDGMIRIKARPLSTEEAIGDPESDDFPLQKGKERLMQAEFNSSPGQAFTDQYGDFEGPLADILEMELSNNYRRALFIASLNAVLRHIGKTDRTIHCHDIAPGQCAMELCEHIKNLYNPVKITQIGYQPAMVTSLAASFNLRVIDLDEDNIGATKSEVVIEGPEATTDAIKWCDLLLVTGSTVVNGTIEQFLDKNPVLFYGTTIAGPASLMGWDRFCPKAK
jgi:uncharacterized protein (DUF4213/DUF364 family)